MSDFKREMICVLFGAVIGFVLTVLLQGFNDWRERARAKACLKAEIAHVGSALFSLVSVQNKTPTISLTELPMLVDSGQGVDLPNYSESVAKDVISLKYALRNAEASRRAAADLLMDQQSPSFVAHATAYVGWLRSAKEHCDSIRKLLKCEPTVSGDGPKRAVPDP